MAARQLNKRGIARCAPLADMPTQTSPSGRTIIGQAANDKPPTSPSTATSAAITGFVSSGERSSTSYGIAGTFGSRGDATSAPISRPAGRDLALGLRAGQSEVDRCVQQWYKKPSSASHNSRRLVSDPSGVDGTRYDGDPAARASGGVSG
jgi:hypothetical protein